jgi:hypothetical protein
LFRSASLLLALLAAGCGDHTLGLALSFDPTCSTASVPAGGSIQYVITSSQTESDAGSGAFCGGCLAVGQALGSPDAILAFLRAQAPPCPGVHPGATLLVRLNAFGAGDCPAGNLPLVCARSQAVPIPDGHADGTESAPLACTPCNTTCVPMSCMQQGKNCGFISDGCTTLLDCGMCKHPLMCGGGPMGMPNVCGK